jgi:hypothetical protein
VSPTLRAHRAEIERVSAFRGIMSGTARCVNTRRSLTRSLDQTEEGLAMQATRVRVLDTDPATGQTIVRHQVPDESRRRRRRGTGSDHITDQGYRYVTCAGHPLADKRGRLYEHRRVLFDSIGAGPHSCHWCNRPVAWKRHKGCTRLVVDHLNDDKLDNRPENLVPSCTRCNGDRGRRPDLLTHCERGHEWTSASTYIRPDNGSRQCRICARENDQKRRGKCCPCPGCSSVTLEHRPGCEVGAW